MINCPECGSQISNQANACPKCGCPIRDRAGPVGSIRTIYEHSDIYPRIKAYAEDVKPVYNLSVIGIVLCLGIGFVFALISLSMGEKLQPVDVSNATPADIAEYQIAENKAKKANGLAKATLCFAGAAILLGILIGSILAHV